MAHLVKQSDRLAAVTTPVPVDESLHTLEVDCDHYLGDLERECKKGRSRAAS